MRKRFVTHPLAASALSLIVRLNLWPSNHAVSCALFRTKTRKLHNRLWTRYNCSRIHRLNKPRVNTNKGTWSQFTRKNNLFLLYQSMLISAIKKLSLVMEWLDSRTACLAINTHLVSRIKAQFRMTTHLSSNRCKWAEVLSNNHSHRAWWCSLAKLSQLSASRNPNLSRAPASQSTSKCQI